MRISVAAGALQVVFCVLIIGLDAHSHGDHSSNAVLVPVHRHAVHRSRLWTGTLGDEWVLSDFGAWDLSSAGTQYIADISSLILSGLQESLGWNDGFALPGILDLLTNADLYFNEVCDLITSVFTRIHNAENRSSAGNLTARRKNAVNLERQSFLNETNCAATITDVQLKTELTKLAIASESPDAPKSNPRAQTMVPPKNLNLARRNKGNISLNPDSFENPHFSMTCDETVSEIHDLSARALGWLAAARADASELMHWGLDIASLAITNAITMSVQCFDWIRNQVVTTIYDLSARVLGWLAAARAKASELMHWGLDIASNAIADAITISVQCFDWIRNQVVTTIYNLSARVLGWLAAARANATELMHWGLDIASNLIADAITLSVQCFDWIRNQVVSEIHDLSSRVLGWLAAARANATELMHWGLDIASLAITNAITMSVQFFDWIRTQVVPEIHILSSRALGWLAAARADATELMHWGLDIASHMIADAITMSVQCFDWIRNQVVTAIYDLSSRALGWLAAARANATELMHWGLDIASHAIADAITMSAQFFDWIFDQGVCICNQVVTTIYNLSARVLGCLASARDNTTELMHWGLGIASHAIAGAINMSAQCSDWIFHKVPPEPEDLSSRVLEWLAAARANATELMDWPGSLDIASHTIANANNMSVQCFNWIFDQGVWIRNQVAQFITGAVQWIFNEFIFKIIEHVVAGIALVFAVIVVFWVCVRADLFHIEFVQRFQDVQPRASCSICMDDFSVMEGISCSPQPERVDVHWQPHFLCTECFNNHVRFETEKQEFKGHVLCPHRSDAAGTCASAAYSRWVIAQNVTIGVFEELERRWLQLREQEIMMQLQRDQAEQLQRTLQQSLDQQFSTRINIAQRHIQDNILTLKCPRRDCQQAFFDFDGCFALKCSRCRCGFCAWCLQECGDDAHNHVRTCPHKRNEDAYFGTPEQFKKAQQDRCKRLVVEFLNTLDANIRRGVQTGLASDLRELGLPVG